MVVLKKLSPGFTKPAFSRDRPSADIVCGQLEITDVACLRQRDGYDGLRIASPPAFSYHLEKFLVKCVKCQIPTAPKTIS